MTSKLKPLLADTCEDITALVFPVIASPKLDGIRCMMQGAPLSRTLKVIPNVSIQEWAATYADDLLGLDGELIVGEHDKDVYTRTTSGVMGKKGTPDFTYWVFDNWDTPDVPYSLRLKALVSIIRPGAVWAVPRVRLVPTKTCRTADELAAFEAECLARGFEGVMVRKPDGKYKNGRSTLKEAILLKIKRFKDAEAEVIGYEERQHNDNEKVGDGLAKRGTSAAGLRPAGDLGALVCKTPAGVTFNIGTGFTAAQRVSLWKSRQTLKGMLAKYKHFEIGAVEAPRFPVFLGFRDRSDV